MGLAASYITRLVARRGQAATLIVPGAFTQDEYGGSVFGPATEHAVAAIVTAYGEKAIAAYGGIIARDDRRVFLCTSPVEPKTTHRLRIGGQEHRIVSVTKRTIAGPVVAYDLQVRHG
jgi:hypothetical protein